MVAKGLLIYTQGQFNLCTDPALLKDVSKKAGHPGKPLKS